jgi:hypothetical protein
MPPSDAKDSSSSWNTSKMNKGVVFRSSPPRAQCNNDDCGGSGGNITTTTRMMKALQWLKTARIPTTNKGVEHSYQRCGQRLGVRILESGNKGHLEWEGQH